MYLSSRKAFTMLELTFVIVIIGILSAVAMPKFAATRDDATISKAKSTVAAVRNAIATEHQKRILQGDYTSFSDLAYANGADKPIFDFFDGDNSVGNEVIQYPPRACKNATAQGCWISSADTTYTYRMPATSVTVDFTLAANGTFSCNATDATSGEACKRLSE